VTVRRNALTVRRNALTVRRNTVTVRRNALTVRRNALTVRRNALTVLCTTVCVMQNAASWCNIHNMKELAKQRLGEEQQFIFLQSTPLFAASNCIKHALSIACLLLQVTSHNRASSVSRILSTNRAFAVAAK
jgi:hypothetical protein